MSKQTEYQPKTGLPCDCKPGVHRDNCPDCEGTGQRIDFAKIRARNGRNASPEATPRPWKAARVLGNDVPDSFHVLTSTFHGQFIAGCGANEANAALIVRAVNSHDALRRALKLLIEAGERGLWGAWADNTPNGALLKSAREAIAAAEAEEGH